MYFSLFSILCFEISCKSYFQRVPSFPTLSGSSWSSLHLLSIPPSSYKSGMEVLSKFLSNWTSKLQVPSSRELKFSAPPLHPSTCKSGMEVPFHQGWKFFLIKLDFHLLRMMQVLSSRELKFSTPPHPPSYKIGLPSSMMEVPSSILLLIKDGSSFSSNWTSMMEVPFCRNSRMCQFPQIPLRGYN